MISTEKMRKYFNKMSDKITAKRIVKDNKFNIKYDDIDIKRVGVWCNAIRHGRFIIIVVQRNYSLYKAMDALFWGACFQLFSTRYNECSCTLALVMR